MVPMEEDEEHYSEKTRDDEKHETKCFISYLLILIVFLSVQFGHGSNIGVAVSLPGDSKAMNLALGSWVMVGVCLGLPVTPWLCRSFGPFRVCIVALIIDFFCILLMLYPGITVRQIYTVRFLVGFFEAPLLPYLQEWLAHFGKHSWNVWNTVLHAMVPLGENLGYVVAQELSASGYSWQSAFAGQALVLALACTALVCFGGKRYLDITPAGSAEADSPRVSRSQTFVGQGRSESANSPGRQGAGSRAIAVAPSDAGNLGPAVTTTGGFDGYSSGSSDGYPSNGIPPEEEALNKDKEEELSASGAVQSADTSVEYPVTERWAVFWATNVSLAAELGFLSGSKYVIRDYAVQHGYTLHFVIFTFSTIALCGPALGGAIAMSGSVIRPDQWSQHKKTLSYLLCVSTVASILAMVLLVAPSMAFFPMLFATFIAAGGVYPAAQGIINIALTETRVIEASVYQVQCNNLLFAMPMPYAIGKSMDMWGVDASFHFVVFLQVVAACGFLFAVIVATCTEERSAWNRLLPTVANV